MPPATEGENSNGGFLWMNYLAGRIARTYGITVIDGHRLMKAAILALARKEQCGDGYHCMGRDACWAKALIMVQYMIFVLTRAPMP